MENKESKKYINKEKLNLMLLNSMIKKIETLFKIGSNFESIGITMKLKSLWYFIGLKCSILLKPSPIKCKGKAIKHQF